MNRAARASLLLLFACLAGVGLYRQPDPREVSATSFGRVPEGFGALHEWLHALDLPTRRSFVAPDHLPGDATVWWIAPPLACATGPEAREQADADAAARARFVARGGTAVVFLGPRSQDGPECSPMDGIVLPERAAADGAVEGPLVPAPRLVACDALAGFSLEAAEGASVMARKGASPFVIVRTSGAGRIVLVADAAFLENRCFARDDAAPLAADLVRAFGTPLLDEHAHGLRAERGVLATLASSPAAFFLAAAGLLGVLLAWRGAAVPPARAAADAAQAPSLEEFVASLAALYAGTGDHARVLEQYRELTAARLRRLFGLPPGTPRSRLAERLARIRGIPPAGLEALASQHAARERREVEREARALDALVEEAAR